jgi:hypothetical protein
MHGMQSFDIARSARGTSVVVYDVKHAEASEERSWRAAAQQEAERRVCSSGCIGAIYVKAQHYNCKGV